MTVPFISLWTADMAAGASLAQSGQKDRFPQSQQSRGVTLALAAEEAFTDTRHAKYARFVQRGRGLRGRANCPA